MSLYDELYNITAEIEDPLLDLERVGITDHYSVRSLGMNYGKEIATGIQEEHAITHDTLALDLGATFVGGFYIGLEYARRFQEANGRLPWDLSED